MRELLGSQSYRGGAGIWAQTLWPPRLGFYSSASCSTNEGACTCREELSGGGGGVGGGEAQAHLELYWTTVPRNRS